MANLDFTEVPPLPSTPKNDNEMQEEEALAAVDEELSSISDLEEEGEGDEVAVMSSIKPEEPEEVENQPPTGKTSSIRKDAVAPGPKKSTFRVNYLSRKCVLSVLLGSIFKYASIETANDS